MDGQSNSNFPKIISNANKNISQIIDLNMKQESELLKKLVEDVYNSSLEIKKLNNQRVREAKNKITQLYKEIDELSTSIKNNDRNTLEKQLNLMIDTENLVYDSNKEIRDYDYIRLENRIHSFDENEQLIKKSNDSFKNTRDNYHNIFSQNNELLRINQNTINTNIFNIYEHYEEKKLTILKNRYGQIDELNENIKLSYEKFDNLVSKLNQKLLEDIDSLNCDLNFHNFYLHETAQENDIYIDDKTKKIDNIKEKEEKQFLDDISKLREQIANNYEKALKKLNKKYQKKMKAEESLKQTRKKKLQEIRFKIIDAENNGILKEVNKLVLKYNTLENQKIIDYNSIINKLADKKTKKTRLKIYEKMKNTEIKFIKNINKFEFSLSAVENDTNVESNFFKMSDEFKTLDLNKKITRLKSDFYNTLYDSESLLKKDIYKLKNSIKRIQIDLQQDFELLDLSTSIEIEKDLYSEKKLVIKNLLDIDIVNLNKEIDFIKQESIIKQAQINHNLHNDLSNIQELIIVKRNETNIKNLKIEENNKNKMLLSQAQIDVADKEYELKVAKVKNLYENELALINEQNERITIGVKVNDSFVETTLKNQMLFASEQIECAENEYTIRLENIEETKNLELDFANGRIFELQESYNYERGKLKKELDDKLDSLEYKLILYTGQKDVDNINYEINKIKDHYNELFDEIDEKEANDDKINVYKKTIEDTLMRVESAENDALKIKEDTIASSNELLEKTKERYQQAIEEKKQINYLPVMNNKASQNAYQRYQLALKEAELLLKDRVEEPKRIIERTKDSVEIKLNKEELDKFIKEQRTEERKIIEYAEIKKKDIKESSQSKIEATLEKINSINKNYDDSLDLLDKDLDKNVTTIQSNDSIIKQRITHLLEENESLISTNNKMINKDLILKKRSLNNMSNTLNENIANLKKPYTKYLKFTSNAAKAKKRKLKKEFDKILTVKLKELDSKYKQMNQSIYKK